MMRSMGPGKLGTGATARQAIRLHFVAEAASAEQRRSSGKVLRPGAVPNQGAVLGPGTLLARRYRLERALPARTRGPLWHACELSSRGPVVTLQLLDAGLLEGADGPDSFLEEARRAARIEDPHVARVLDYGVDHGLPYLVFERLEGESLAARLSSRRQLATSELERVIRGAARGLAALHANGQLHRRLDPAHVFLTEGPEPSSSSSTKLLSGLDVILGDGSRLIRKLARELGEHAWSRAVEVSAPGLPPPIETSTYQSPEQILGHGPVDARSDLWSLAVIAFEGLTGVPAFPGATLGERLVRICNGAASSPPEHVLLPPRFMAWFQRAVSRDPARRFATAEQFEAALAASL